MPCAKSAPAGTSSARSTRWSATRRRTTPLRLGLVELWPVAGGRRPHRYRTRPRPLETGAGGLPATGCRPRHGRGHRRLHCTAGGGGWRCAGELNRRWLVGSGIRVGRRAAQQSARRDASVFGNGRNDRESIETNAHQGCMSSLTVPARFAECLRARIRCNQNTRIGRR